MIHQTFVTYPFVHIHPLRAQCVVQVCNVIHLLLQQLPDMATLALGNKTALPCKMYKQTWQQHPCKLLKYAAAGGKDSLCLWCQRTKGSQASMQSLLANAMTPAAFCQTSHKIREVD